MMLAAVINDLLTTVLVICAVVGYVVKTVAEERGWLRPARVLRVENQDLLRRNTELEETIGRHARRLEEQAAEIRELRGRVAELKERDQASVLAALKAAQDAAVARYDMVIEHQEAATHVLEEIRDMIRNGHAK